MKRRIIEPSYFHIGMRNLKTAFAATLCALLYFPFGRNPTFACIGTIFGMGSDLSSSWLSGGNRLFGTIIGGFLGMAIFRVYIIFCPEGGIQTLLFPFLFLGVVLLIMLSQVFQWPGAIQPGGVVLCIILFNTPVDTYIAYSLNRMFDTGVGVILALLINLILPRERVLKIINPFKLVLDTINAVAAIAPHGRDVDPDDIGHDQDDEDHIERIF